jgi:hypothetical protein
VLRRQIRIFVNSALAQENGYRGYQFCSVDFAEKSIAGEAGGAEPAHNRLHDLSR